MFFIDQTEHKLTTKKKLQLWLMLFIGVPAVAWLYGHGEYLRSDQRRMATPVHLALPAQLPNIWDF